MVLRSLSDPMIIPICAGPPADSASDLPEVDASWRGSEPDCLSVVSGVESPTPVKALLLEQQQQ